MIRYTLYFGTNSKEKDFSEDIELALLNNELGFEDLSGYTIYSAMGYYDNTKEKCYVLIHFGNEDSEIIIKKICKNYKEKFKQESILVTKEDVSVINDD